MILSKFFSSRLVPEIKNLPEGWQELPVEQVVTKIIEPGPAGIMLHIGEAFLNWWKIPSDKRTVLRVNPSTAKYLSTVGINHVPSTPPSIWNGQAIVLESAGGPSQPLIEGIFSIAAYFHNSITRLRKELCVVWFYGDTAGVTFFPCGSQKIAVEGKILRQNYGEKEIDLTDTYPGIEERAIAALRILLATSYYAEHPQAELVEHKGPLGVETASGASAGKKYASLWKYRNLIVSSSVIGESKGERAVDGLVLSPVYVRPYIRLKDDKPIFVQAHASHRWKTDKPDSLGTKVTL